jgi:pimeloyl-ACP methyl ester carboxylesterase
MSESRPARPDRFIYLHGFASSARSAKGVRLAHVFAERGADLATPDLNRPSFATLDHDAMLAAVDAVAAESAPGTRFGLIGSSLGGWLATRWAELNPGRVAAMVLLCPGFDMVNRWPRLIGADRIERWRERGALPFPDHTGEPVPVHWGFIEAALRHPPTPAPSHPTLIIHGTRDAVVPVDSSRAYAAAFPGVQLHEVDDDHALMASMPLIEALALEFFDLK